MSFKTQVQEDMMYTDINIIQYHNDKPISHANITSDKNCLETNMTNIEKITSLLNRYEETEEELNNIRETIVNAYLSERTEIGKNVIRQLAAQIGVKL